jgi:putative ABC transport system ATP-binding protein
MLGGMAGNPVLVATDIHKTFNVSRPPREVVRGVSLQIDRGEMVALMGRSGCGKSTLLHILGGLEPPDGGDVEVLGKPLYQMKDSQRTAFRRDNIGFVFQFFNLIPSLTAAQNISLPLQFRNDSLFKKVMGRSAVKDRVGSLMDLLNLHGLQGHGPDEISGGEQQKVAIARALVAAPALLLADEPTGNLDWTGGHEVMAVLSKLTRDQAQTTLVVTHDAPVAAYADRVLVMRDGEIIDEIVLERAADKQPRTAHLIQRLSKLQL